MPHFDIYKVLSQTEDAVRRLAIFNPFTIRRKGTRAKAIFALAMVCFFWGTTWIASKEGVRHMPALQMSGIRQFLGGACYLIFFLARGARWPNSREWGAILLLSFLNFMMSNGLSTWGLRYINSGLGAIMGSIFPLWLVIIAFFTGRGKMPVKAAAGLFIGFAGVCIVFYEHLQDFLNPDFRFGIGISLIATITWALGTLYTKKKALSFNPYFSLGLQMVISGTALMIFTETSTAPSIQSIPLADIHWKSWAAITYLVIFGSVISFLAYLYALQHLPTGQASIYAYINPVVAVLLGWLLFNESLTAFIAVGVAVTLLGVYMVNKAFRTSPVEQPEAEGV